MKIIGLISDTHIPNRRKELPKGVIKAFKDAKVDLIIHAGDFEDLSIVPVLKKIAPLEAVHGNMCRPEVKTRFPSKKVIEIENLTLGITHGSGGPSGDFERLLGSFKNEISRVDIIISGHTHKPGAKLLNGVQIINPGSPTDKYFAPRNTVAILEIDNEKFQFRFIDI